MNKASRSTFASGLSLELVAAGAVAVIAIVSGPFGTAGMDLGQRTIYWAALIGWNLLKWHLWFAVTYHYKIPVKYAAIAAVILLNLLIPLEIGLVAQALQINAAIGFWRVYLAALLISAAAAAITFPILLRLSRVEMTIAQEARLDAMPEGGGLLARAGIFDLQTICYLEAQDHYVKVQLCDGTSRLVHGLFSDTVRVVDAVDGIQVRRGLWVARSAVKSTKLERGRWQIVLHGGKSARISESHTGLARSRGWLTTF